MNKYQIEVEHTNRVDMRFGTTSNLDFEAENIYEAQQKLFQVLRPSEIKILKNYKYEKCKTCGHESLVEIKS